MTLLSDILRAPCKVLQTEPHSGLATRDIAPNQGQLAKCGTHLAHLKNRKREKERERETSLVGEYTFSPAQTLMEADKQEDSTQRSPRPAQALLFQSVTF